MRDTRNYVDRSISADALDRILEAGRVSGNAMNCQRRRLVVLESCRDAAARLVTRPSNLRCSALAVAVIAEDGKFAGFDAGRMAQNMMVAAWNDGVASCPNAIADQAGIDELLGVAEDEWVAIVISLGYPTVRRDAERRTAREWLSAADRKPLALTVDVI